MRAQLSQAELSLLTPEIYNQMFTMHGITMVFLVVMPFAARLLQLSATADDRRP